MMITVADLDTWLKKRHVGLSVSCGAARWWVLLRRGQAILAGGMGDTLDAALKEAIAHYEKDHTEATAS